ncbi:hypothetical protein [Winogradskyella immobilis]|uniref:Uncharacterized protein n=1 Tax=Winogradskyella immobilis TaxID=2816852 RepID=A0ABS8ERX3_9FLAO|nr:hypothetical protein [Winogradskyella immobilis]MCC1485636.1 hypothetical protein [Winogradskyella immobilis]MCG0017728.1 hypothetical protein [Winogradskyella immobilis]
MKKLALCLSLVFAFSLISFANNDDLRKENYEDSKKEIVSKNVTLHMYNFQYSKDGDFVRFTKATCSGTSGGITQFHTVRCFLCSQARADRKCQEELAKIQSLQHISDDCICDGD